ncbi:MAG: ABC transporter ATP-binding protein [Pyrobaculum sp.]
MRLAGRLVSRRRAADSVNSYREAASSVDPAPTGASSMVVTSASTGTLEERRVGSSGWGTTSVLKAVGLAKRYGKVVALDGVSLEVDRGEMFCIVGPNGAGKTTFIESALGFRRLDAGSVYWFGEEVRGRPPPHIARRIGTSLERMQLLDNLTVKENLRLVASLWGVRLTAERLREVLEEVDMWSRLDARYGRLSAGQKKRVDIAAALLTEPEVLIFDEPEANLDPLARIEIMDLIRRLNRGGITVIYSTHSMEIASRYSTRVAVMNKGKVLAIGDPAELAAKYGGKWRVAVRLRRQPAKGFAQDGDRYVAEFDTVADALKALHELGSDIVDVAIEAPTLAKAFESLVRGNA